MRAEEFWSARGNAQECLAQSGADVAAGETGRCRESEIGQVLDVKGAAVPVSIEQDQARQLYRVLAGALNLILVNFSDLCREEANILVGSLHCRFRSSGSSDVAGIASGGVIA